MAKKKEEAVQPTIDEQVNVDQPTRETESAKEAITEAAEPTEEEVNAKKYEDAYNKYLKLKGAYPNPEWQLDELLAETEKLEAKFLGKLSNEQAKKDVVKEATKQVEEVSEPTGEPKEDTTRKGYVNLRNKLTGHVIEVSPITYALVKNNKEYEVYIDTPPEVKHLNK